MNSLSRSILILIFDVAKEHGMLNVNRETETTDLKRKKYLAQNVAGFAGRERASLTLCGYKRFEV